MSSEYKDWLKDRSDEAKEWVAKYPFLRFKNNSCCPWENTEEIESCWIFDLPTGWTYTCGKDMCDELLDVLGEYADDFVIDQMKEKWNEIRCYWSWENREYTDEEEKEKKQMYDSIENILRKYAEISYNTCTVCGKTATKWTRDGWIASFCDECYKKMDIRD